MRKPPRPSMLCGVRRRRRGVRAGDLTRNKALALHNVKWWGRVGAGPQRLLTGTSIAAGALRCKSDEGPGYAPGSRGARPADSCDVRPRRHWKRGRPICVCGRPRVRLHISWVMSLETSATTGDLGIPACMLPCALAVAFGSHAESLRAQPEVMGCQICPISAAGAGHVAEPAFLRQLHHILSLVLRDCSGCLAAELL